ncbi:hypothetical protein CRENBAI_010549 [Crenichthys baileyi]|uniref:CUB domain-containing protein n=1 Tax=Crenichthys baileyi TaxID=28760 RepID=A0AAV9R0M3_9TELE
MLIHFSSDSHVSGQGFNASFSKGCGGLLHVDRGVLSSPYYPENYLPGLNCSWHVMVTAGFRVSVSFQSPFQIQGYGSECSSGDYLEGTAQDTLEGLCLSAGLGTPWAPPEELEEVSGERDFFGVSAESADPTTRSRISGRRRIGSLDKHRMRKLKMTSSRVVEEKVLKRLEWLQ